MCAARLANLPRGTNRFTKVDASKEASTSAEEAAHIFGVSRSAVQRAIEVIRKGTRKR